MVAFLDKKYINLVSPQLDKFAWQKATLANCRCPLCGDSKKNPNKKRGFFYERQGRYYYKCHNCGAAMGLSKFLETVSPALYSEFRLEWLKEKSGERIETHGITSTGINEKFKSVAKVENLIKISDLCPEHPARQYLESRKIPKLNELFFAEDFGKVARQINPKIFLQPEQRIVIPFYDDDGHMIGVQGRAIGKSERRYMTIKSPDHERLFYNLHKVNVNERIYVTEGPFDSMFLPNAIAMVGAAKSVNLPDKLKNTDIVFVMDNEPRSVEIVEMMRNLIAKGHKVFIPERLEQKDINDVVLSGKSIENIVEYIDEHTYDGILAQANLGQWEKTTVRWKI